METGNRFVVTKSGVQVYRDWREAVRGIDADLPAIRMKGDPACASRKDIFHGGKAQGLCKACSVNSEDTLTWVLFRSMERVNRLRDFFIWAFSQWSELKDADLLHALYWGRRPHEFEIDRQVAQTLVRLEPYHERTGRQHTETDFAAVFSEMRIPVESKLGKGIGPKSGWEKGRGEVRPEYRPFVEPVLKQQHRAEWEQHMKTLYQPLRQLALANLLEGGDLQRVGLLLLVNEPGGPNEDSAHRRGFGLLRSITAVPEKQIVLLSWQDTLAQLVASGHEDLATAREALCENPQLRPPLTH